MSIVIADPDMCERLAALLASVAIPTAVEELRVDDLSRARSRAIFICSPLRSAIKHRRCAESLEEASFAVGTISSRSYCRRFEESEDVAIRRAVHDAIVVTSKSPGLPDAMTLHYTFWNLFRNVCTRED